MKRVDWGVNPGSQRLKGSKRDGLHEKEKAVFFLKVKWLRWGHDSSIAAFFQKTWRLLSSWGRPSQQLRNLTTARTLTFLDKKVLSYHDFLHFFNIPRCSPPSHIRLSGKNSRRASLGVFFGSSGRLRPRP